MLAKGCSGRDMFRARYVVICIVLNRPIADKSTNKSWTDIPIGTGPLLAGLESHLLGTGNTFKPSGRGEDVYKAGE